MNWGAGPRTSIREIIIFNSELYKASLVEAKNKNTGDHQFYPSASW